jgi:DNA-binding Lrp family transcriptional regulator
LALDDLDKKILQHLSRGISSYEDLARTCNVTRNTIYRRIAALEDQGIIKNTIRCTVNLEQLEITPVWIGVRLAEADLDKASILLAAHRNVRLLLRSYGDYNLNLLAYCEKGKEGKVIHTIRAILERFNGVQTSVSVGFVWEKADLETFDEQLETNSEANVLIEIGN